MRQCLDACVPLLGICLGAQLIAKAAGAVVMKAPIREVGWYEVRLTDAGACDPLLHGFTRHFDVFQFHEDTFELPPGAVHVIDAPRCPNQGFRIGQHAYGLQFHLEATEQMIQKWVDGEDGREKILHDTEKKIASCHRNGEEFFKKFLLLCS